MDCLSKYQNIDKNNLKFSLCYKNEIFFSNPKFVLRNYLAQEAIQDAEKSDFTRLIKLLEVLKNPYAENPEFDDFAKAPPEWGKKLEISCSS